MECVSDRNQTVEMHGETEGGGFGFEIYVEALFVRTVNLDPEIRRDRRRMASRTAFPLGVLNR